jgi:hypothetical protein
MGCASTGDRPLGRNGLPTRRSLTTRLALFRIERATGNVYTDGAFFPGGADVAEYVTVSEPVEPGDVVEIDPAEPQKLSQGPRGVQPLGRGSDLDGSGGCAGGEAECGKTPPPSPPRHGEGSFFHPHPHPLSPPKGEGSRGVRGLGKGAGGLGLEPGERGPCWRSLGVCR